MITQHNEFLDSRYYTKEGIINKRTGLIYVPSVTTILSYLPEGIELKKWRAQIGWEESFRYMHHRAEIGSYVHNKVEESIKLHKSFLYAELMDEIMFHFKDQNDQNFILGALKSWMNFIDDMSPEIIKSEESFCNEDYAGTKDLVLKMKGETWVVDLKTSKQANDHHKVQVEAYRRDEKTERGGVLVLGNQTKKGYTLTEIKPKDHDEFWEQFLWALQGFYLFEGKVEPKRMMEFEKFETKI